MKEHYERMLPGARLWTGGLEVEMEAIEQIRNVTKLPILAGPVAVMPDVHLGKGATVGTVIPTRAAIVPAAVGVDIGCGMLAVKTNLVAGDLPHNLGKVRAIERDVSVGFDYHNQVVGRKARRLQEARRREEFRERCPKPHPRGAQGFTRSGCGASSVPSAEAITRRDSPDARRGLDHAALGFAESAQRHRHTI
jgi:tRNA-splicing ligase RtcB